MTTKPHFHPPGPGWYDSSFELSHGLDVHEAAASEMALDDWLARYLQRGDVPRSRATAAPSSITAIA